MIARIVTTRWPNKWQFSYLINDSTILAGILSYLDMRKQKKHNIKEGGKNDNIQIFCLLGKISLQKTGF